MADTTPMKGIPSRVPTGGFRSPPSATGVSRPGMTRPAGRKDGGIKLLEITEQPLGYAAAKKRKRQQELEEQQKKALEAQSSPTNDVKPVVSEAKASPTITPDYAAGLTASSVYSSQPATPMPATGSTATIKEITSIEPKLEIKQEQQNQSVLLSPTSVQTPTTPTTPTTKVVVKQEKLVEYKTEPVTPSISATPIQQQRSVSLITTQKMPALTTIASSSPATTTTPSTIQIIQANPMKTNPPAANKIEIISSKTIQPATTIPKNATIINQGGNLILTTKSSAQGTLVQQQKPITSYVLNSSPGKQINIQRIVTSTQQQTIHTLPTLTTTISRAQHQQQLLQNQQQQTQNQTQAPKIIQIKTAPTVMLNSNQQSIPQNIPPLISTQQKTSQPTILNIQTLPQQQQAQQRKTYTITAQNPQNSAMLSSTSVAQILQQHQLQQQQQQQQQQQTIQTSTTQTTNQPKLTQVVMSSPNVKGKTILLTNPNILQKGNMILKTVGPTGNTTYQQIPIQNMSGLQNLGGTTILTSPPSLIKTDSQEQKLQQIPALVPTSSLHQNMPALAPVVIQPVNQQQQNQQTTTIPALITNIQQQKPQQPQTMTIIRPVSSSNVQQVLPQGLTLIQRPGQQPQLVQTIQSGTQQNQPLQRTIITRIPQQQGQQQTIQIQQQPQQHTGATIQIQQIQQPVQQGATTIVQQQQGQQTPQGTRKGLSLSNKHVMEAHEMFKKANRVTRLDKALILGFMAGYRDNPRPNSENVVTIKLNESKEKMKQEDDSYALMLVESLITLDYNTGLWRTFRKYSKLDGNSQQIVDNTQQSVVI